MTPIEAARAALARRYPNIGEDDDTICADCFTNIHVRDGAEWLNGHDVCDECASKRLSRTERALTAALAEVDRLTAELAARAPLPPEPKPSALALFMAVLATDEDPGRDLGGGDCGGTDA